MAINKEIGIQTPYPSQMWQPDFNTFNGTLQFPGIILSWENKFLVIEVLGNVGGKGAYVNIFRLKKKGHRGSMKRKVLLPAECVGKREPPTRSYGGFPLIQELNGSAGQHHAPVLWRWGKHRKAQVRVHTEAMCHNCACAFTTVTGLWGKVQRENMSLSDRLSEH